MAATRISASAAVSAAIRLRVLVADDPVTPAVDDAGVAPESVVCS